VALSDAVDLLAFGRDRLPIGLSNIAEHAARLSAGLALMLAGKEEKVTLCGNATFRLPEFPGGIAPVAMLRKIEPKELADMTLVVDGARDWLGPTRFADEYSEIGQGTNSVSFVGVTVHRESLRRWLAELSGKASEKKRGPKFKYDWISIGQEANRLMNEHGDFAATKRHWDAQARLERQLLEFCARQFDAEPGLTQLRAHIGKWLSVWHEMSN
jgi:hypothetical protein